MGNAGLKINHHPYELQRGLRHVEVTLRPYTLNPKPYTLDPKSQTLNPKS